MKAILKNGKEADNGGVDANEKIEDISKLSSNSERKLSLDQLALELNSVSSDWKSLRNPYSCSCCTTFDFMNKKVSSHYQVN